MPKHDISHPAAPSGQGFASPLLAAQVSHRSAQPLTPWFPSRAKPARVGVYEKDFENEADDRRDYQYWDGCRWYYGSSTPQKTADAYEGGPEPLPRPWRGLANNPALKGSPSKKGRGQMTKEMP